MKRRNFISTCGATALGLTAWPSAFARSAQDRTLILIELKGGNDGLNTVVPYADPAYATLRPRLALKEPDLVMLSDKLALHKELAPIMPWWQQGELAIVQGLGYPQPNLSHFRSIEIWETASRSNEYLENGWLARTFAGPLKAGSARWTADGVVVGGNSLGALAGGSRAVTLNNPETFLNQARLAAPAAAVGNSTLAHVLKVEADIQQAANGLRGPKHAFAVEFPRSQFGAGIAAAMQVLATQTGSKHVPVIHLQLGSFDTHVNQLGQHANLLKQLAEGMVALKAALKELNRWDNTLVMTYAEFGRRPRENQNGGTDHGTVAPHFVAGGAVKGGLYGSTPNLGDLDRDGNPKFSVDFRQTYATVLQNWWGVDRGATEQVLAGNFSTLSLLKA
jgi:uncharacterized protein (DUF1501 family)